MTWMRKMPNVRRIDVTGREPGAVADEIVRMLVADGG
jgi:hypothetical protein